MKVTLDRERCVGHGRCYEIADAVFGEDERGHCVILTREVPQAAEAKARQAAANCPERAIAIED